MQNIISKNVTEFCVVTIIEQQRVLYELINNLVHITKKVVCIFIKSKNLRNYT